MVSLIDLKPVRRCGRCSHLIPKEQKYCPYCNGDVKSAPHSEYPSQQTSPAKPREPMSPETKKKILIGGGVAAAIIVVLVIFNMVQGMFRLDKSIYEPLDKSDIAALEKDDPQFGEFYEQCQLIIQTMNTAEFRKKYGEITYKQLREYLNYYGNKAYSDEVLDEEKKNYEKEIYIPIKPKVDALVEKWNKFVEDNDVNKYLQINAKYSKGQSGWETVPTFYFICKMPKGKLSDCSVTISLIEKSSGMQPYGAEFNTNLSDLLNCNSQANAFYWRYSWRDGFWNDYEMHMVINSVTLANGKTIKADAANEVPEPIKEYIDTKDKEVEFAIIKDFIDENYPSENEYAMNKLSEKLKDLDPLCYELLTKVSNASDKMIMLNSFDDF